MNDYKFYTALIFLVIIFILAFLLILIIYKLFTTASLKEEKKKERGVTRKSIEQTVKKTVIEKKVIDYRKKIKEMAEADPEFVASKLKKWLKEK